MAKEEFENFQLESGWKRVTADEWADYTSDYNTYATERRHNGSDTMINRLGIVGATVDVSCVHYVRVDGEVQRIYAINEAAKEIIAPYNRRLYYRAKEQA